MSYSPPTKPCDYCKEKPSTKYIIKLEINVCETCNLLFDPGFRRINPKKMPIQWIKE